MIGGWVGPQAGFTRLQLSPERYPDTVAECVETGECMTVSVSGYATSLLLRVGVVRDAHQNQKRPHCTHTPDNL